MDEKGLKRLIREGAKELGNELDDAAIARFFLYLKELKAWNKKINLTAITSDKEIVLKHFIDSLTIAGLIKKFNVKRLLDIGTGAGFPGIPLKIAMPELQVILMDSTEKKVFFLRHILRTLWEGKIEGIEALKARAEDPMIQEKYSEAFDCAVGRAIASLKDFVSAGLPYVHKGGLLMAIKGPKAQIEIKNIKGIYGIAQPVVYEVKIPFSTRVNLIIVVKKTPASNLRGQAPTQL